VQHGSYATTIKKRNIKGITGEQTMTESARAVRALVQIGS